MAYSKTIWENNKTKLNADNMNKIENGIETNSNNMPTDINTDSYGYLILEHDGVEITGQKKLAKIGKYNSSTATFEFNDTVEIDAFNNYLILAKENNRFINFSVDEFSQEVDKVSFNVLYNDAIEKTISLTIPSQGNDNYILTNLDIKTLFGNSLVGTGNINLYRHQLTLTNSSGQSALLIAISSNNLKCASVQDLKTITNATSDFECYGLDRTTYEDIALIAFSSGTFIMQSKNISIGPVTKVSDVVTPI